MAVKVVLTNRSQETNSLTSSGQDGKIRVNRIVYQGLRSLAKNKTILEDYDNNKIPKELMELYDKFTTLTNGGTVDIETQALDEYLGSLGVDQTYEYVKDIIDIDAWMDVGAQALFRNVVDDSTGSTNNVIERTTGYNVIHNTEK